jgi:hypothetical protein
VTVEFKTFGHPIKNKEKIFEKNYREDECKIFGYKKSFLRIM